MIIFYSPNLTPIVVSCRIAVVATKDISNRIAINIAVSMTLEAWGINLCHANFRGWIHYKLKKTSYNHPNYYKIQIRDLSRFSLEDSSCIVQNIDLTYQQEADYSSSKTGIHLTGPVC